ncbi:MAG: NAD(+)/NADH kinase [Oscillospiraceae bacterium]|jgi:NAD+ kinase|nr:NAD(+)/NADH kinase [Oscillospiraceae bacterium]
MKSAWVFTKNEEDGGGEPVRQAEAALRAFGIECVRPGGDRAPDIMITVGGDGTLLRGVGAACRMGIPILGINAGNVGFLTGIEKDELHLLERLKTREYRIDERMMLALRLEKDGQSELAACALNEISLTRGVSAKAVMLHIEIDGREYPFPPADGLIIATPTGSTGYSLSAGGPLLHPQLRCMALTPVNAYAKRAQPLVLPASAVVTVRAKKTSERPVYICADGDGEIPLADGVAARITESESAAAICRVKDRGFIETLCDKLG